MNLLQIYAIGQDISNKVTLTGKVKVIADSSGLFYSPPNLIENDPYALPGGLVIVMNLDSTIVKGSTANLRTGIFKIEGLTSGEYILKTYYIGYEDRYINLKIGSNESPFLDITLGYIYHTSELPFNQTHAENDLRNGKVQFKIWPKIIGGPHPLENQKLQEKFGFTVLELYERYTDVDQQQWEKLRQATIRYNMVVDEYLSKKYPKEWKGLDGIW